MQMVWTQLIDIQSCKSPLYIFHCSSIKGPQPQIFTENIPLLYTFFSNVPLFTSSSCWTTYYKKLLLIIVRLKVFFIHKYNLVSKLFPMKAGSSLRQKVVLPIPFPHSTYFFPVLQYFKGEFCFLLRTIAIETRKFVCILASVTLAKSFWSKNAMLVLLMVSKLHLPFSEISRNLLWSYFYLFHNRWLPFQ